MNRRTAIRRIFLGSLAAPAIIRPKLILTGGWFDPAPFPLDAFGRVRVANYQPGLSTILTDSHGNRAVYSWLGVGNLRIFDSENKVLFEQFVGVHHPMTETPPPGINPDWWNQVGGFVLRSRPSL